MDPEARLASSRDDIRRDAVHEKHIAVKELAISYGRNVVLRDVSFSVPRGEIFVIMGGSGSGKSTLLKAMIGLKPPHQGDVFFGGVSFWSSPLDVQKALLRRTGILYQRGALWSSMTLAENIALPLEQYTDLPRREILELVTLKLSLVGLAGLEDSYPAELSGGMQKRAGLARAMALDPEVLLFDEPSAGLDPVKAKALDDLILELRDSLGTTILVVTHELASIFAIADEAILLDGQEKTIIAQGKPQELLSSSRDQRVRSFLTRDSDDLRGHT
jgi:phospholipid/cholesterol/gamma-HCH transport system ATP-binding protein